jgi:adenine/guanine phosphoribosyltransferase-like PRPP-binding protein
MQSSASDNDFWVFRDGRRTVSGTQLLGELRRDMHTAAGADGQLSNLLNALIRAGELESALWDIGSDVAERVATATDALASALYGGGERVDEVADTLEVPVPEQLEVSPPEGFCYYALHPADFGRLALRIGSNGRPAAIIGIRTIGTTLSAVVTAALRSSHVHVNRITVRPTGHPYDRVLHFTEEQLLWIKKRLEEGSTFLVVDEGPGRSGSTFLATGEALIQAGVDVDRITLLGSRHPDSSQLCSVDASRRWTRFRFEAVTPDSHSRFRDFPYIGGGEWRRTLLGDESLWPATWPQMERLKFLSPDGRRFWKFEGMGRLGQDVLSCSRRLAECGFGVEVEDGGDGFASYARLEGRPLRSQDLSKSMVERISEYCAFRAAEFEMPRATPDLLSQMVTFNIQNEFGVEIELDELADGRTTLTDGRMQPWEWILCNDGRVLKTDSCAHGNDHFFPGPCNITWDLAGAVVEWGLDADSTERVLSRFNQLTGEDVSSRFDAYLLAYSVSRLAWSKMALPTLQDDAEEIRLRQDCQRYRVRAQHELAKRTQMHERKSVAPANDSNSITLALR